MVTRNRTAAVACLAAVVAAVLGGCGTAPQPAAPAPSPAAQHQAMGDGHDMGGMSGEMAGMSGMGGDGLALWSVQKAGGVVLVTDGDGNALYRSDADRSGPPRSACVAGCLDEWEPVAVPDGQPPELMGVASSAVGTMHRADGTDQLTLGGWPLYRHRGDSVAQPDPRAFVGRGWFAVSPAGGKIVV